MAVVDEVESAGLVHRDRRHRPVAERLAPGVEPPSQVPLAHTEGPAEVEALIDKLRPDRFTATSGKMAAIVGYILNERFSDPAISELVVTSDGFVLAQREGEVGANEMIAAEADLNRNLLTLIETAGLSDDEVREFGRLQRERIRRY